MASKRSHRHPWRGPIAHSVGSICPTGPSTPQSSALTERKQRQWTPATGSDLPPEPTKSPTQKAGLFVNWACLGTAWDSAGRGPMCISGVLICSLVRHFLKAGLGLPLPHVSHGSNRSQLSLPGLRFLGFPVVDGLSGDAKKGSHLRSGQPKFVPLTCQPLCAESHAAGPFGACVRPRLSRGFLLQSATPCGPSAQFLPSEWKQCLASRFSHWKSTTHDSPGSS